MNKYLVTGIPHSEKSGAGDLVAYLAEHAPRRGFSLVEQSPMPAGIWNESVPQGLREAALGISRRGFERALDSIEDSEVLLLYPQRLGFESFLRLIERNRRVGMYVLDASFFCIQSYNHRSGHPGECLDCLGGVENCATECRPQPLSYKREDNLQYLKRLAAAARKVVFFVQSPSYGRMLGIHFGGDVRWHLTGMRIPGILERLEGGLGTRTARRHDVVFHASPSSAKGVRFALALAARLPGKSFLFPDSRETLRRAGGGLPIPSNATCRAMSWETGLREEVEGSSIVLCPSLWSAPVEGALIKSVAFNGNAAVVASEFGFEKEFPDDALLRLPPKPEHASRMLGEFLESGKSMAETSRPWLTRYMKDHDPAQAFELLGAEPGSVMEGGTRPDTVHQLVSAHEETGQALAELVRNWNGISSQHRARQRAEVVSAPLRAVYRFARRLLRTIGLRRPGRS